MQQHDGQAIDTSRDATGDIDVWYGNPETGGVFGFSLPLPPSIPPQIAKGSLVRVDGPDSDIPQEVPPLDPMADGASGGSTGDEDDPILHPCQECGNVAVKVDGAWTEHCGRHQPKPGVKRGR